MKILQTFLSLENFVTLGNHIFARLRRITFKLGKFTKGAFHFAKSNSQKPVEITKENERTLFD